jgi:GNAT superfamily N-acetyltransferase
MTAPPRPDGAELTLRDGSKLTVRSVRPGDKSRLRTSFAQMSDETRYRRFMTIKDRLTDADLRTMTEVDHLDGECILAFDGSALAGSASYFRNPRRRHLAEVAVDVAEGYQRRGIATALGHELARRARRAGIRRFEASMLAQTSQQ